MGILFVLAFWAIAGTIIAFICMLISKCIATFLLRPVNDDAQQSARARIIKNAMILPFAFLIWAGFIFVFQAVINTTYLDRDIGIGDSSYCPLPNGYSILMIDVGDEGTIMRGPDASEASQSGALSGVRELQIEGPNIFGGRDSQSFQHFVKDNPALDSFFALDTRTGRLNDFKTQDALRVFTSQSGATLRLEPISKIYTRYRFTWFDLLVALLLFLPPAIAVALILRSIIRLRQAKDYVRTG